MPQPSGPVAPGTAGPGDAPPATTPPAQPPPSAPAAPAACEGLVPADPGGGVAFELPKSDTPMCRPAITDGKGEWIGVGVGLHVTGYRFVPASGQGTPAGALDLPQFGQPWPIAPQPSGYHAIDSGTAPGGFRVYDAQGDLVSEGGTRFDAWIIAPDPDGGSALYEWDTASRKPSGAPGDRLELVGADGKPRASALLDRTPADLAVTFGGDVLVLSFDGQGWSARWFDRGARPLGDWFALPGGGFTGAKPALLADGSVGVHDGTRWTAVVPDGKEAGEVPAWLASRAVNVEVVRGRRANAFLSWTGSFGEEPCGAAIELVTAAGESCGTVKLAVPGGCRFVDVGPDGTALVTSELDRGTRCVWRWWSGLLR